MASRESRQCQRKLGIAAKSCLFAALLFTMLALGATRPAMASSGGTSDQPEFMVRANRSHDWVEGWVGPNTHVVVDFQRGGETIASSEQDTGDDGWFHLQFYDGDGKQVDLQTGDTVNVTSGANSVSLVMLAMNASVDVAADRVIGRVEGVPFPAKIQVERWGPSSGGWEIQTDAAGQFELDLASQGVDVLTGTVLAVWYVQPSGHMIGIVRSALHVETDLTDNDVWGQTEPDSAVHLEVHAPGSLDLVKAIVDIGSDSEGSFGYRFEGDQYADIVAGDTIVASVGGLETTLGVINPFSAAYDYRANTVCGQAPPGEELAVDLYGFGKQQVIAAADGSYCADFSSAGDPGIDAEGQVSAYTSMEHWISIRVRTPSPDLRMEKWGEDSPVSGRTYDWTLRYRNEGDRTADGTAMIDTLPTGLNFVSESTGSATVAGRQVIWNLGNVEPGDWVTITLRTRVNADSGADVQNCAEATTTTWERNNGNNGACDTRTVVADEVDLEVNPNSSPGDAVPGEQFRYQIGYCNHRPASALNVVLTQTVPAEFSVDSLWTPTGWTADDTTPGLIRWTTPLLRGGECGQLFAQMTLSADAPRDQSIRSDFGISSASPDVEPGNDVRSHDLWVGSERVNLWIQMSYGGGNPVAGYDYTYWIDLGNGGNTVLSGVALTNTLPAGATLVGAKLYVFDPDTGNNDLESVLAPEAQGDGWAQYRLDTVNPWGSAQVAVTVHIASSIPVGTELIDSVEIASELGDEDPANNTAEYAFTTQAAGPNLWVRKWSEGDICPGCGFDYLIRIVNNGTEPAQNVVLSDLFPSRLEYRGAEGPGNPQWNGSTVKWDLGTMRSGEDWVFRVHAGVAGDLAAGTELAQLATATTSSTESRGDDNAAVLRSYVGPNLQIEKRLCEGERLAPGWTATYCIVVRNVGDSYARNVVIRDTLPAGMSYESDDWGGQPEDDQIVWHIGDVGSEWQGEYRITVRVDSDAIVGQSLTNAIEVSDDLGDADPSDNRAEVTTPLMSPYQFRVQETDNWVGGRARANQEIALTLRDGAGHIKTTASVTSNDQGDFRMGLDVDIAVGDVVQITPAGGSQVDITVTRILIVVKPEDDSVEGHVTWANYPANLRVEAWESDSTGPMYGQTDSAGSYSLHFDSFDVHNGSDIAVWHMRDDGHELGVSGSALRLFVVQRPGQWAWGRTTADTDVSFRLLDATGDERGAAEWTTGPDGGFEVHFEKDGEPVSFAAGDAIVAATAARSITVTIPYLLPLADVPTDSVIGRTSLAPGELVHVGLTRASTREEWWQDQNVQLGHGLLADFSEQGIDLGDEVTLQYVDGDHQRFLAHNRGMVAAVAPRDISDGDVVNTVTVAGTAFVATPQVRLARHGYPPSVETTTTFLTGGTLTVQIPKGIQGGVYDILVVNPDGNVGYMSNAIRVLEWHTFLPYQKR